ncbi:EamA family transporter [Lentzea sp. CA-135723]|uniref:EamA family transporter n=1 Tax=Lentzea sp. CA-135723 TaxID=3239950 RepID=UPI003D8E4CEC
MAIAGGAIGQSSTAAAPWYGTLMGVAAGVAYTGYLLLFRRTSSDARQRLANLTDITIAAAAVAAIGGVFTGDLDLTPSWSTLAWLLVAAVTGQVIAWVLVGSGLSRLAPSTGSALLLVHPIAGLVLSALLLAEVISLVQLLGCAIVLVTVALLTRPRP